MADPDFSTGTVYFDTLESGLIYSMIWGPDTLDQHVYSYMVTNRAAAPGYDELAAFVAKATATGIVEMDGKRFQVRPEWYRAIHVNDGSGVDEIHTMVAFCEWFEQQELKVTKPAYSLSREEYDELMAMVRSFVQRRFGF